MKISNPVLPGFDADPSMIRVGDTYYIANSTFDWWPGVRLHESRDMVHWNLLPGPLNRVSQLDMKGNPSGGGRRRHSWSVERSDSGQWRGLRRQPVP